MHLRIMERDCEPVGRPDFGALMFWAQAFGETNQFTPGEVWLGTAGHPIQAFRYIQGRPLDAASRYVAACHFQAGGTLVIEWRDSWDLSVLDPN